MTNLVLNPGFELCVVPNITPDWYKITDVGFGNAVRSLNVAARTGTNCAILSPENTDCILGQNSINTIMSKQYVLSFWINPFTTANDPFIVRINGVDVLNINANILNVYTQYKYIYVASGPTDLQFFVPQFTTGILLDDVSITENIVCFPGRTKIYTCDNKNHEEKYIEAKKLNKNEHQVYSLKRRSYVPIKDILVTGPHDKFYMIPKDSLSENSPNEDLYLTSGHGILYKGCEMKARDLPIASLIKTDSEDIYTIVTGESEPLLINNAPVFSHLIKNKIY